jgi:hypothetical protein
VPNSTCRNDTHSAVYGMCGLSRGLIAVEFYRRAHYSTFLRVRFTDAPKLGNSFASRLRHLSNM